MLYSLARRTLSFRRPNCYYSFVLPYFRNSQNRSFHFSTAKMRMQALAGVKVIELAGLAPVPLCGQILADFGADVTLVLKPGGQEIEQRLVRHKKQVTLGLKEDLPKLRSLILEADVLLEPYRPGVLEAVGLDPVELLKQNEKLIVARLTGYGQTGRMATAAGHDINYVALSGLLPTVAGHGRTPYWTPANLLADFAGGSLATAFAVVSALHQRNTNGGKGAIVDASMTEGLAYLGSWISAYRDQEMLWDIDFAAFSGTCPIYRTYETKDGKFMAVGALEPKFNKLLFQTLGIKASLSDLVQNPQALIDDMEKVFKSKTRDEWTEIFSHKDACVTPVLDFGEVHNLPQHRDRQNFEQTSDGKWQPQPAPRIHSADEFKALRDSDANNKSKM